MSSTTFLFWNLNRKPIAELVAGAVREHRIDVVILAECQSILSVREGLPDHNRPWTQCPSLEVLVNFPKRFTRSVEEGPRYSIRRIFLPLRQEILLAVLHLPSKLHMKDSDQAIESGSIAEKIRRTEKRLGHRRTIVVGDFNMNPFETGMVATNGFHSTMARAIAERKSRTVQGEIYPMLYNPMWSHFGDAVGVPGTYFYDDSNHVPYHWNMFDQVLIAPDLLGGFHHEDLSILTKVGSTSLIAANGKPDAKVASDHLPIVFRLQF